MLKKSAAIFLVLLYLSTVSGFALNLHYCFNHLSSVKIDAPAKACVKGFSTAKMKCCHDKRIEVKVKDSHQATKSSILKIFNEELLFIFVDGGFFSFSSNNITPAAYRGPPVALSNAPIYLVNCTFRV
ncbi:MAG: hypothetical protein JSU01_18195 [Bacteroidetes bacterium]|nr:hypothetical protein [Bacteroidota bacterium]